jgi:hypothetical protein
VKITSVRFGSALPAEVDATSAAKQYAKLAEVKKLDADLGLHLSFSGRFVLGQK